LLCLALVFAMVATEWLVVLSHVCKFGVNLKDICSSESFSAQHTHKVFFFIVPSLDVHLKLLFGMESFATMFARKGLFTSVHPLMAGQCGIFNEPLVTDLASEWEGLKVHKLNMFSQVRSPKKLFPTILALVNFFFCVSQLMLFEHVFLFVDLVANPTDVSCMLFGMLLLLLFGCKCFVAL